MVMRAPGIVITCEHGGNQIPPSFASLFAGQEALLATHRGYDPGALQMAEDLAVAFTAPLVAATVSRLLVDLNRSVGNPAIHAPLVRRLPPAVRHEIRERHYQPYRVRVEQAVRRAIDEHGSVIHLSSHSFTPELDGKHRTADVGLLYDPRRAGEVAFCARWKASLKACAPDLSVRRNYPYAGKGDGMTAWFRRHLSATSYIGIELEINQKHVFEGGRHWDALRARIVDSLRRAIVLPAASQCA